MVTALTDEQMADFKIEQVTDLARLTPGFTYSAFSYGTPFIAIRGATNTFEGIGVDKPVAIMVDDVFIPRYSEASVDLFDLAQAEVLPRAAREPCSGRNVTGGAVVLTTEEAESGYLGRETESRLRQLRLE